MTGGVEGRQAEGVGELQPSVGEQREREAQPLDELSLVVAVLRGETEDANS